MALKSYLAAAAAATMVATPVMAVPTNPAASLSLAAAPRASTHVKHSDDVFAGVGLIIAIVAGTAVVVGVVVIADNSSSN